MATKPNYSAGASLIAATAFNDTVAARLRLDNDAHTWPAEDGNDLPLTDAMMQTWLDDALKRLSSGLLDARKINWPGMS